MSPLNDQNKLIGGVNNNQGELDCHFPFYKNTEEYKLNSKLMILLHLFIKLLKYKLSYRKCMTTRID